MTNDTERRRIAVTEILVAVLVLLGGAMTYLYLQDREDAIYERRTLHQEIQLLKVKFESVSNHQEQLLDDNRDMRRQIEIIRDRQEGIFERRRN